MKQYVIDELRPLDYEKIKQYFDEHIGPADMGDLYWIPMDTAFHTEVQASHTDCHPLYFAIQLSETSIIAELLVRTKSRVRCDCISYANDEQFLWLIHYMNAIFERLEIMA